ncbi:MAG: class I SAM-dependent DNA methyltransferase, partial [Chloroflexota bacterium]|nr:class I SAM-dependent DNA methyltransferase [Chloroflexota bacterium]
YYTPKPVVSFMCREGLKGYLRAQLPNENEPVIAHFVDSYDATQLSDAEATLRALQRVTVCDPACGSGAYLLGMMQELLLLRQALFTSRNVDPRSMYDRKLEIIQNNISGVDNDPFATNIAQLR